MSYPPHAQPLASADNTNFGLDNSRYHAEPHPIIVKHSWSDVNAKSNDKSTSFPGSLSFSSLVVEKREGTREKKKKEPGNEVNDIKFDVTLLRRSR